LVDREALLKFIEARSDIEGRFTKLRRVGKVGGGGNFSLVFTAVDGQTPKTVALKVFHPQRLGETYRLESFRREARLLGNLSGQSDIVTLVAPVSSFDVTFTAPGISMTQQWWYYAVEYASTNALECITNSAWDSLDCLDAFVAMCRSVQRIHRQRIAHRDLKPENFLLVDGRGLCLSDFGAACEVDSHLRLLPSYTLVEVGDPRYAAPEIIAGLHDDDPSIALYADIYALGAILFELFTGSVLGLQVLDPILLDALAQGMAPVPKGDRAAVFGPLAEQIAAARPLPSIQTYNPSAPAAIADRLNRLYQAMAHLDYRRRLTDFSRIFNELRACRIILRKEDAYRRWKVERERRRQVRLARRAVR
jgi:serine/threonine protein kinase